MLKLINKYKLGWVLSLILCSTAVSASDVSFTATVDQTTVGLDEHLTLTLSVSVPSQNKVPDPRLPNTGSLKVLGTSTNESMSYSFSGGRQSFRKQVNTKVYLQPSRVGKAVIGRALFDYKGKRYTTKPITVTVVKSRPKPKPKRQRRRSPFGSMSPLFDDDFFDSPMDDFFNRRRRTEIGEQDIFIKAVVSNDQVVVGQQLTISIVIYSRVGGRVSTPRWPKLEGFYSLGRDVSGQQAEQKVINGLVYQYSILGQKALFPLHAGEIEIEPIEVEIDVSSPFRRTPSLKLKTQTKKITVLPLPKEGRPDGFSQANVGRYRISAEVDTREVKLNQPVTYTIKIEGSGSLQRIRPPELPDLPRFKKFDPTVSTNVSDRGREVRGSKVIEHILVPLASGKLEIPALKFSFFDPFNKAYRTLQTRPQIIRVAASGPQEAASGIDQRREVNIVAGAFKPIRFESSLKSYGQPFYQNIVFRTIVVALPSFYLLLLLVGFFRSSMRFDSRRSRMKRARDRSLRHMKNATKLVVTDQADEFFAELKHALLDSIQARCDVATQGLTFAEISNHMGKANISAEETQKVLAEIENCDFGRFAPAISRQEEMQAALERVRRVMKNLEYRRNQSKGAV
jgi:hypothetical protein